MQIEAFDGLKKKVIRLVLVALAAAFLGMMVGALALRAAPGMVTGIACVVALLRLYLLQNH